MPNDTVLIEIPLIGMNRESGGDKGGFSYSQGMSNSASNEWKPAGAFVESPDYDLYSYTTQLPIDDIQSPDVAMFDNRGDVQALNFNKTYAPKSDIHTIKDPATGTDYLLSVLSSARSYNTPLETVTLKISDWGSKNPPCAYLYSLGAFCSYNQRTFIDHDGDTRSFWGLDFYSKYTGRKLNNQTQFYLHPEYGAFSRSSFANTTQTFITEDSSASIGVLGYYTSGSNPDRAVEFSSSSWEVKDIPDKNTRIECQDFEPTQTWIANFDGDLIGYDKIVGESGNGEIIDVIAVLGAPSGVVTLQVTSRLDRSIVSQVTSTPAGIGSTFYAYGSVFISPFSNDVLVSYAFNDTGAGNTGVRYQLYTLDKSTGALSLNGSEVTVYSDLIATGVIFNAFGMFDQRKATASFAPVVVFQRVFQSSGNIGTYKYNSASGNPAVIDQSMYNVLFNSQPVLVENDFIFIGAFGITPNTEFGNVYITVSNYGVEQEIISPVYVNIYVSGVCGYNTTYGQSYSQIGYCEETKIIQSIACSANETYSRTTQVGVCQSVRPIRFNGEVYFFSGFQYKANPQTGFQRVGNYTRPRFSITESGTGAFSGVYSFRMSYRSFGGEGPVSDALEITPAGVTTLTIEMDANALDLWWNIPSTLRSQYMGLYALDPSDGLYKECLNSQGISSLSTDGVYSFTVDVSSGLLSYGAIAQFETGEAPQVGVNSPRLASLALSRIVCTDEFSEKIYTSKSQSESTAAEFSDLLFINASPSSEPVTEISELNNAMVVFSENSIYAITGSLPDSFGEQSLSEWQLVSEATGCKNPASTLITDLGIYFASEDGINLLNRGFQIQPITKYKGFLTRSEPTLTQDFWWKSASQDGTDNIFFSTSSLRSRLEQSDFMGDMPIFDSVYSYNEKFGTLGIFYNNGVSKPYNVSGIWGGIFMLNDSTRYLSTSFLYGDDTPPPLYDTGWFCPFGQFTYGQICSVYVKMFRSSDLDATYPPTLVPSVDLYVRDDETSSESHLSTQSMEDPEPVSETNSFVFRVRITNRRCNAVRIIIRPGVWGLRGLSIEAIPQAVGGVKRRVQGVT